MTNMLSILAILIGGGSLVGLLSGLFGIGGALIIVPLLNILFSHMGMPDSQVQYLDGATLRKNIEESFAEAEELIEYSNTLENK